MRNLLLLHLESISIQRLAEFGPAFPNLRRLLDESLVFDRFFASATSTTMVMSYLLHANDFEFDPSTDFETMQSQRNNPHLLAHLQAQGYRAHMLCLNGFRHLRPARVRSWDADLPEVFDTGDFPALFARFDELTNVSSETPFAIYVWDLISHIEHSLALAPHAQGLTDQLVRACKVADDAIGFMRATLDRKGLLDDTTIVLFGDHGDDWSHGYKGGLIHGAEPYANVIRAPLGIRDPRLRPGTVDRMASTIDLAPTCYELLGIDAPLPFRVSGRSLLNGAQEIVFSQNYAANQPDDRVAGIAQAHAAIDDTYALLASSRGLELYAYRLDPDNHCNLLHLMEQDAQGQWRLAFRPQAGNHFRASLQENPQAVDHILRRFARLREVLAARVAQKRAYIESAGVAPRNALAPDVFDRVDLAGRDAYFGQSPAPSQTATPAFQFSYRLR